MKKKLEWNVMNCDFNSNEIIKYNVIREDLLQEIKKKKIDNYEDLKECIRRWAIYHYMSRAEYEIVVGGLFADKEEDFSKIDIYFQIEMNLDRLTEYIMKEVIKK